MSAAAEEWRRFHAAAPNARWRTLPPTDAQLRVLRRRGLSAPETRGEASAVIAAISGRDSIARTAGRLEGRH